MNADPLRAPDTDDESLAFYAAGYETGWLDAARLPAARSFFIGLLVGIAATLAVVGLVVRWH